MNEEESSEEDEEESSESRQQGSKQWDVPGWTLAEREKVIKAMQDQEINSGQQNSLKREEHELILMLIITLESLRPIDQRLNLDEIIAMSAAIFSKNYTGDKLFMIIEQVRRLENDSNLKKNIQSGKNSDSAITKHTQQPYQRMVKEAKCEDIMKMELKRVNQTALEVHTDVVTSVAVSADDKFIVSGSANATIKVLNLLELREECKFTGHTDFVSSVAVSADGTFIVSGSRDKNDKSMEHTRAEGRVHIHRAYRLRLVSGCECRW